MPFIDSFYSAKEAKKPELDRVCHNNSTCPLGRVISAHTNGGQGLAGIVSAAIVRNAIARGNRFGSRQTCGPLNVFALSSRNECQHSER